MHFWSNRESRDIEDAKLAGRRGNIWGNFPDNIPRNLWVINFVNLRLSSYLTGRHVSSLVISLLWLTATAFSYVRQFAGFVRYCKLVEFQFYFIGTSLYSVMRKISSFKSEYIYDCDCCILYRILYYYNLHIYWTWINNYINKFQFL